MFNEIKITHKALITAMAEDNTENIAQAQAAFDKAIVDASADHDTKLKKAMDSGDEKLTALEGAVTKLEADAVELNADLVAAQEKVDGNDAALKVVTDEKDSLTKQVEDLDAEKVQLKTDNGSLTAANLKLSKASGEEHLEINNETDEDDVLGVPVTAEVLWGKAVKKAEAGQIANSN